MVMTRMDVYGALIFRARHPTESLHGLNKALGMRTSHHVVAGTPRVLPSGRALPSGAVWKESIWTTQRLVKSRYFARDVAKVLATAKKHRRVLSRIVASGGSLELYLQLAGPRNSGDNISVPILRELAALQIELQVEVFPTMQSSWLPGRKHA